MIQIIGMLALVFLYNPLKANGDPAPLKIEIGDVRFMGDGCPSGTARAAFSPDNLSFSLVFDAFVLNKEASRRPILVNKKCTTLIPMTVPKNYQLSLEQMDYRGFVEVPKRALAAVTARFTFLRHIPNWGLFYPSGHISQLSKTFWGAASQDYLVSSKGTHSAPPIPWLSHQNHCGGKIQMKIDSALTILSLNEREPASITIDSVSGKNNALFKLKWKRCR